MRKTIAVCVSWILMLNLIVGVCMGEDNLQLEEAMYADWAEMIISNTIFEPVVSTVTDTGTAYYTYSNGERTSTRINDTTTIYNYQGSFLSSERKGDDVLYFGYEDNVCTEICYEGLTYYLKYDDAGNVAEIRNEHEDLIGAYVYENIVPEIIVSDEISDVDSKLVLLNPIQYGGWHYDVETGLYYVGEGIFYDPNEEMFIQGECNVNFPELGDGGISVHIGEGAILLVVQQEYEKCMSSTTYGATAYSNVTSTQWNNGSRWYSSVPSIELVARCIYGENDGEDKRADRSAIGVVILNRIIQKFPTIEATKNARNIVTYPAAFSTINPKSYSNSTSETALARAAKSKTNKAWQEATLISCILQYTQSKDMYNMLFDIPSNITNHTHFLGVNYAYNKGVFSVDKTTWTYGGTTVYNVCIAGGVSLSIVDGEWPSALEYYVGKGYNVFFSYAP